MKSLHFRLFIDIIDDKEYELLTLDQSTTSVTNYFMKKDIELGFKIIIELTNKINAKDWKEVIINSNEEIKLCEFEIESVLLDVLSKIS